MSSSTVVGTFVFELSIVLSDDLSGSISSLISSWTICVVEVASVSVSLSVVVLVVPAKKLVPVPSELPIFVSATLSVLWIVLLFQIVMYFSTQQFFGEVEQ